jgi:type IV pilus assembly protein PilA
MLQSIRRRAAEEKGFTLIELLVVILIIGILAAIALPSFINQRSKGQDANAKSWARTAATAEETYFTDNQTYTNAIANLTAIEPTLTNYPNGSAPTFGTVDATQYSFTITSKSGTTYTYARTATGAINRTCSGGGGCNNNSW